MEETGALVEEIWAFDASWSKKLETFIGQLLGTCLNVSVVGNSDISLESPTFGD